jgi:hypothetical protein
VALYPSKTLNSRTEHRSRQSRGVHHTLVLQSVAVGGRGGGRGEYKKGECKRRKAQSAPERHPQTTRVPEAPPTVILVQHTLSSLSFASFLSTIRYLKSIVVYTSCDQVEGNKECNKESREFHGCLSLSSRQIWIYCYRSAQ